MSNSEENVRYLLPQPEFLDMLFELHRRMEEVQRLLLEGLEVEGAPQKQWYLWMIADMLKIDFSGIDLDTLDKGRVP